MKAERPRWMDVWRGADVKVPDWRLRAGARGKISDPARAEARPPPSRERRGLVAGRLQVGRSASVHFMETTS